MSTTFQFISVNPNQIVAEIKSAYEQIASASLNPADVEMIMIQTMAYREMAILAKMEAILHQNFVQLANGSALDYWGEIFGVSRITNEDDDDYRVRILGQSKLAPIGTRGAYKNKAKSVSGVADCYLQSKQDDITIPPGMIVISIIQKVAVGASFRGDVANNILELFVGGALNDYQTNIIGDIFQFEPAIPVPVDGAVIVRKKLGTNSTTVENAVDAVIDEYFNGLSLTFDGVFENNELYRRIQALPDVHSVNTVQFLNVPVLAKKEFYQKGTVNTTVI